jgi:hypothetical protein
VSVLLQGLGICLIAIGILMAYGPFHSFVPPLTTLQFVTAMVVALPAFYTIGVGLIFYALGEGLHRLDEISRASRQTAAALREILDRGADL